MDECTLVLFRPQCDDLTGTLPVITIPEGYQHGDNGPVVSTVDVSLIPTTLTLTIQVGELIDGNMQANGKINDPGGGGCSTRDTLKWWGRWW